MKCILNLSDSHENKFCYSITFTELHRIAYEMIFNGTDTFPDHKKVNSDINKLGFVSITEVASNGNQVRYTFHHPTFLEFFAAIHLLDLNQEELEQLYLYIKEHQQGMVYQRNSPWLFYFGLMGAHYRDDDVSAILRQLSVYGRTRYPYCYDEQIFEYVQEIGWTSEKLNWLLDSAGIIVNSTLFVDLKYSNLEYVIDHAIIHLLRLETQDCKGYMYLDEKMASSAQSESLKSCLETHFYHLFDYFFTVHDQLTLSRI